MEYTRNHFALIASLVLASTAGPLLTPVVWGADAASAEPTVVRKGGFLKTTGGQTVSSIVPEMLEVLYAVPAGQIVKKGDLLIELDAAFLREQLREQDIRAEEAEVATKVAEAALMAAQEEADAAIALAGQALSVAELEQKAYLVGEYPLQQRETENAVRRAQQRITQAEKRLASANASDNAPPQTMAEAQAVLLEAKDELTVATERQGLLKVIHSLRQAQLKLALDEKRLALMHVKNERTCTVLERQGAAKISFARYEIQRDRRDRLHKHVTDCKLYAPRDGMVLYSGPSGAQNRRGVPRPRLEPGDHVSGGSPIVTVVDPHCFEIDIPVAVDVARRIKPGHEAAVCADAWPEHPLAGRVARVEPVPSRSGDKNFYRVTVRLEDPEGHLRLGMSAQVELTL